MDPPLSDQLLPFFKPYAECLTQEQLMNAVQEKLVAFPEVVRTLNDPQTDEDKFVLISFLKSNQHSYVKVRGYGTFETCRDRAKQIIKSVDSRLPIAIAKLGQWCYVTSDPKQVSKNTIKIVDDKEITQKEHVDLLLAEQEAKTKELDKSDDIDTRLKQISTVGKEDELHEFIRRKVMIYETYRQIEFLEKKLTLLHERQGLLILLTSDNPLEHVWYKEYMNTLSRVGIKQSAITPEMLYEIQQKSKESTMNKDEAKETLTKNEEEYNKLRYSVSEF
jgi:hypothetical protein